MPKISIPIKSGVSSESVVIMAETLGRMTGTVVEVQSTLEITASEPVIKALLAIAPIAKGKRKTGNRYTKAAETGEPFVDLDEKSDSEPAPAY